MKLLFYYIASISLITILAGCKKENMHDIFKSTGQEKTEIRQLHTYDTIFLKDNVNLFLIHDTTDFAEVSAGDDLIELVKTEYKNTNLIIKNTNKCNWVRSFKPKVNVTLHYTHIKNIYYTGFGNITTLDTIKEKDFCIEMYDGSGSINLLLNTQSAYLYQHVGCADITANGITVNEYIYNNGVSPFFLKGLNSFNSFITYQGENNCYITVQNYLWVRMLDIGNIYYSGNPTTIEKSGNGKGQLIHQP